MAHKKAGGSSSYGRDSNSKRLGIKIFGGQRVKKGEIIARQNGSKFHAGKGTALGSDYTLYALSSGVVAFKTKMLPSFTGKLRQTRTISVIAAE